MSRGINKPIIATPFGPPSLRCDWTAATSEGPIGCSRYLGHPGAHESMKMPDLPACIKALAELELVDEPYANYSHNLCEINGLCGGSPLSKSGVHERGAHDCKGTGRIVPFKELRVVVCKDAPEISEMPPRHIRQEGWNVDLHEAAGCPGWVPEPDLEKACWRLLEAHPRVIAIALSTSEYSIALNAKETVISAAEAWAQEQQK